jgi:DNA-binding MarR family transcriptional regulator
MQSTRETGLTLAGTFYRNRDEWIRAVTSDPDVSITAKAVGCYLAVRINKKTRDAFPQQTTMAREIGVSRSTIMRAVAELVEAEWLEKAQTERGRRRAVNRYSLVMPWAK